MRAAATPDSLLHCFQQANQRMMGLPIHHPALMVEIRGAQPLPGHDGAQIMVLITPWCMNLIILRDGQDGAPWQGCYTGLEQDLALPCGQVRFVVGDDGLGGFYQMCSLFSPMDDFSDHASAQAVADETIKAVLAMTDAPPEPSPPPPLPPEPVGEVTRRDLFRGLRRERA